MSKNKFIAIIIWAILFSASVFLLFMIPNYYSISIFVALAFDCIAFLSQLIIWLIRLKTYSNDVFWSTSTILISTIYMIVQFIICVVTAILNDGISLKVLLIINVILMALMWVLILAILNAKNHANRIDSRQKEHHVEL